MGAGDLLDWANQNGAASVIGYDIEPKLPGSIENDSLMTPPDYEGKFLISNPPYLASNKCRSGDKSPYQKWKQNDYYKCHIASLWPSCKEGILILPSNFLCESNDKARQLFFDRYEIVHCRYWNEPVFEDATTGIVAFHFRQGNNHSFSCEILPAQKTIKMDLSPEFGYMHGKEFFQYLEGPHRDIRRTEEGQIANTKIVVGSLDKGKYPTGFHFNEGSPIPSKSTVITTYQMSSSIDMTDQQQKQVIEIANSRLSFYREKYDGMFLSNYLGANQKILSQRYARQLLSRAIDEVLDLDQIL